MTTTPRTWVVGETVTAALLNTEIRDQFASIFQPWTVYTPTWAGVSALGSSVSTGRWLAIGRTVKVLAELSWGAGSTLGTGNVTCTLPFISATIGSPDTGWRASGRYKQGGGGPWAPLFTNIQRNASVVNVFSVRPSDGQLQPVGSSTVTWVSGSHISVQLEYEIP